MVPCFILYLYIIIFLDRFYYEIAALLESLLNFYSAMLVTFLTPVDDLFRNPTLSNPVSRSNSLFDLSRVVRCDFRESGCITKAATEALKNVARMSEILTSSQTMDLGAYFTMAVRPDRTEVATPVVSSRLNSAREKGRMRVSNSRE